MCRVTPSWQWTMYSADPWDLGSSWGATSVWGKCTSLGATSIHGQSPDQRCFVHCWYGTLGLFEMEGWDYRMTGASDVLLVYHRSLECWPMFKAVTGGKPGEIEFGWTFLCMLSKVQFDFAHLHWCIPKFPWVTGFILEGLLYMKCQCQSPKWQPHSTMSSF